MIKFEIQELEKFLAKINPQALSAAELPSANELRTWNEWLLTESYQIRKNFQLKFHLLKPKPAERYIQMNHLDLLRLMDMVEEYSNYAGLLNYKGIPELYQNLLESLENIFVHLLKYYNKYIDQDLPLPGYYLRKAKITIEANFRQLQQLYHRKDLDKTLLDVAFRPINEFLKRNHNQYSFRVLQYFQEFINEWLPLLDMTDEEDMNWQVHYKMYYLNFNNIEYRIYCTSKLHDKLEALPSLNDRIQSVNWYISTLRRLHQKPGLALLPGQPTIVDQALSVIEEEYQYLIDKENFNELSTVPQNQHNHSVLKVPLTSLQLAQLANALESVGFFPQSKPIEIIRFFAGHFNSIGDRPITESSFHTQYYSKSGNSSQSKMGVIEWLEKIIETLKTDQKQTNFNEFQ